MCSFLAQKNSRFIDRFDYLICCFFSQHCIFLSGFVNADLVVNYHEFREKYSKKKTRGLQSAVQKCDEFLSDPTVSDRKLIFIGFHILHVAFYSL